jgi:hypothetical protein
MIKKVTSGQPSNLGMKKQPREAWAETERQKAKADAPTGNRTQGKCLEGIYVTTTPSALELRLI